MSTGLSAPSGSDVLASVVFVRASRVTPSTLQQEEKAAAIDHARHTTSRTMGVDDEPATVMPTLPRPTPLLQGEQGTITPKKRRIYGGMHTESHAQEQLVHETATTAIADSCLAGPSPHSVTHISSEPTSTIRSPVVGDLASSTPTVTVSDADAKGTPPVTRTAGKRKSPPSRSGSPSSTGGALDVTSSGGDVGAEFASWLEQPCEEEPAAESATETNDTDTSEREYAAEENTLAAEWQYEQGATSRDHDIGGNVGFNFGLLESQRLIDSLRAKKAADATAAEHQTDQAHALQQVTSTGSITAAAPPPLAASCPTRAALQAAPSLLSVKKKPAKHASESAATS